MDPALRPHDVDRLITDFTERVPGVLHAVIVTSDGVPLAVSDRIQAGQLEQLSAITSGLISLACTAARISGGDDVTQALITMELAALVIMSIDGGFDSGRAHHGRRRPRSRRVRDDHAGRAGRQHRHPAGPRRRVSHGRRGVSPRPRVGPAGAGLSGS